MEWIASLMGGGPRQNTALLPGQFHCLLDELPLHLIPRRRRESARRRQETSQQQLFFNPLCSVLAPGRVPPDLELHRHLLKNFNLQRTIAWVRDPVTSSLSPFWLGPRLEAKISHLRAGEPVPDFCSRDSLSRDSLSEGERSCLAAAGILIPEDYAARRHEEWAEISGRGLQRFRERGHLPLTELIHPFHLAALRRYYRHQIRRGAIPLGDEQSPRRYTAHNESVARFFHHQMANAVSAVVGEAIKPSYVYLASYLSGAELKKHTDRQQCEFSVTLCVDFSPEPEWATSWPIRLDTREGAVAVYQALGDGLVYRGTKLPHYRSVLPEGHTSTSIFFHYVPADFSGSLE